MSHVTTFWFQKYAPTHSGTQESFDDPLINSGLDGYVGERYPTPKWNEVGNIVAGDKTKESNVFVL